MPLINATGVLSLYLCVVLSIIVSSERHFNLSLNSYLVVIMSSVNLGCRHNVVPWLSFQTFFQMFDVHLVLAAKI